MFMFYVFMFRSFDLYSFKVLRNKHCLFTSVSVPYPLRYLYFERVVVHNVHNVVLISIIRPRTLEFDDGGLPKRVVSPLRFTFEDETEWATRRGGGFSLWPSSKWLGGLTGVAEKHFRPYEVPSSPTCMIVMCRRVCSCCLISCSFLFLSFVLCLY